MTTASKPKVPRKNKTVSVEKKWQLRLYVAGQSANSMTAFDNLKEICKEHLEGQ